MKITLRHRDFLVIDDLLPPGEFTLLWNFFQEEDFQYVNQDKWVKAFRTIDGQPLWGSVFLSEANPKDTTSSVYPSDRGIDPFIRTLLGLQSDLVPYVGKKGANWSHFYCRPYLYPSGAGLGWHTDARGDSAGAYVFYAHPKWEPAWGAELLIDGSGFTDLDYPELPLYNGTKKKLGLHLDNAPANRAVGSLGLGQYVVAKPNRLVVLRRGILHRIKRVDAAAGDNIRASITGFFMKPSTCPASQG